MTTKLLIATNNRGKRDEYALLLDGLDLELVVPSDLGLELEVAETGETYAENALLKARAFAQASGLLTLADDSGLEVDALDGGPGVYSARYGGASLSDEDRYWLLVRNLDPLPPSQRSARFCCVIALVWPSGREVTVEGACEGRITRGPRGTNGFGYDPVFWVIERGCTMAELSPEVKNTISHRARAAAHARRILAHLSD